MKHKNECSRKRKEPPLLPKWLKSYHLMLFAFIVMILFGAIIKYISNV